MPSNEVITFKVPDDIKATIGKMIALQSLATDPGQRILLAASVMQWIHVGLAVKYGKWEKVPSEHVELFEEDRATWQEAMTMYGQGQEFWTHALLRCQDAINDMVHIAGTESLIDYRQFEYDFTSATFGKSAYQIEDDRRRDDMAAAAAATPGSHDHKRTGVPSRP